MGIQTGSMECPHCKERTVATRPGTNHILHLLIAVAIGVFAYPFFGMLSLAIWLPCWALSSIRIGGWRCGRCGTKDATNPLAVFAAVVLCAGLMIALALSN